MRKITYYCDRCGQHVPGNPTHPVPEIDLCADCASEFLDMLQKFLLSDHKEPEPEQEPAPEPAPKPEKKPLRQRIKLDLGKIGALREAGWTIAAIADEIGVSHQTVANHLGEAMEHLKKCREKQAQEGGKNEL